MSSSSGTGTNTLNILNKLYLRSGYMAKYGSDVWISVILCIIFIVLIFQQYLSNTLDAVKADWPSYKCNPLFMPFAGFIVESTNQTNLEYTASNFTECVTSILEYISENAFQPFKLVLVIINETIQAIVESVNTMRGLLDKLRSEHAGIFDQVYAALSNLVVAFINFVAKMKDTMEKATGLLTSTVYTLFGAYMAVESLFLSMIDLMVLILIIIAGMIIMLIAVATGLFFIPLIGPALAAPSIASAVVTAVVMVAILIPVVWFMIMMMRVLNLSSPPAPRVPTCFAGDTMIPLFATGAKKIKELRIGDKLKNGGTITALMIFTATKQNMYDLHGVQVTGEHRVYHPTQGWLKVKEHPDSQYMPSFNEPYVYCLNTDNKTVVIADELFSDWDDIDTTVIKALQKNCAESGYLPESFTYADIHTYLETGFHQSTTVTLNNGLLIPISEVEINDVLENDTKVLGIIRLQGQDIEHYKHDFGETGFLRGSKNIHVADTNLGIINCMELDSAHAHSTPVLYHLLTDSKFFIANNIRVHDYNYGIDAYLK